MKRIEYSRNILFVGFVLLAVFWLFIFLIGRAINQTASQMNNTIVRQSCLDRFNEISFEFGRTEQVAAIARDFIAEQDDITPEMFETFGKTILKLDPKINTIWIYDTDSKFYVDYNTANGIISMTSAYFPLDIPEGSGSVYDQNDQGGSMMLYYNIFSATGRKYQFGVDVRLPQLHEYMATKPLDVKTYITLVDQTGRVVMHPDSLLIGQIMSSEYLQIINHIVRSGEHQQDVVVSEFLQVPVERVYYPIKINGTSWVAIINIPQLSIDIEMRNFHRYTFFIAIMAVVIFSLLLAVSQARWKREYHLRRKAERESMELQLQQIMNHLNPHFLFNSLNSLYSLIGRSAEQAREFVLSLSRVYRHVLEVETESMSSLENELKFSQEYFFLQKIRFNEQIELQVQVDDRYMNWLLPTLSIQTVIENAVKHNKITPCNPLVVRIFSSDSRLIIENNYTPREKSKKDSLGIGLERIRSIYKLYTDRQMMACQDGNMFRCELPLISK